MQQSDAAVASTSLDNHATESIGAKGWAPNRNNLTYKNAEQKKVNPEDKGVCYSIHYQCYEQNLNLASSVLWISLVNHPYA